jgi:hypothetical protein
VLQQVSSSLKRAVQDFSGERQVNLFNEQAAQVLGLPADELHTLKACPRRLAAFLFACALP